MLRWTLGALMALSTVAWGRPVAAEEPIDHELGKYWNTEQSVLSLQNPTYERKGGFELSAHFGVIPNDSYYLPMPVGARVAYFLTDTLSLEGGFSYLLQGESALQKFLNCAAKDKNDKCQSLNSGTTKPPELKMLTSLDIAWAPFHGKMGIFASKLSNFDLTIQGGAGLINAMIDTSADVAPVAKYVPAGHWGAGFRFYLSRYVNLRVDFKQFLYKPATTLIYPVEFTAGIAFLAK